MSLPDVPDKLLGPYLEVALGVLRSVPPTELPAQLRQYQTWTARGQRDRRVLAAVRRSLDEDESFRDVVNAAVLGLDGQLVELLRAGRVEQVLGSGESPAVVVRAGIALGADGAEAVGQAVRHAAAESARTEQAERERALAALQDRLEAADQRADREAGAAARARAQARRDAEEARRSLREVHRLAAQVAELERRLAAAEQAAQRARDEAAETRRRLDGQVRERQTALEEARREVKQLRRGSGPDPYLVEALGALERDLRLLRRVAGLDADSPAGRTPGPAAAATGPVTRRTPLPAPPGRDADEPETLAAWASTSGALLLVDGYNVTKQPAGWPERSLEEQRTLLVDLCVRLRRRLGPDLVVVFDGADPADVGPAGRRIAMRGVQLVFTADGRIADDEIVARVGHEPPGRPVIVVSSDEELRDRSTALGANVVRSPALLAQPER